MGQTVVGPNKLRASDQADHDAVTVTTTATLVVAANNGRIAITIWNFGSATIYWGKDASVTTANGVPIPANGSVEERDYLGPVYAIAASGTVNTRYWEVGG